MSEQARSIADALRAARYREMVAALRLGSRFPEDQIQEVTTGAEKSAWDLIKDVLAGDGCRKCGGQMRAYTSRRTKMNRVVQYLECGQCGDRPAGVKRTVPAAAVRRRRRRC